MMKKNPIWITSMFFSILFTVFSCVESSDTTQENNHSKFYDIKSDIFINEDVEYTDVDNKSETVDIIDEISDEVSISDSDNFFNEDDILFLDVSAGNDTGIISSARGFPFGFPWVSFYGASNGVDLNRVASYFRIINIDADPDIGNFTDNQITLLKNNGKNRVISYLNVGACESWRSYYKNNPAGFKSCLNTGALTTVYSPEYPDEKWADLSNTDYQNLIVNYVARRLADRGIDGFFLDNLEVVEHGPDAKYGPCDSKCSQGGLDLVYKLREKFPDKLIVMQNATSDVTLNGYSKGIWFPLLLDGISHEEVYSNGGDEEALSQMKKWRDKNILINGFSFWLGVEEYVGNCDTTHKDEAESIYKRAREDGFNAYVTDESSLQQSPCFWN